MIKKLIKNIAISIFIASVSITTNATTSLLPVVKASFFDANGNPLNGGKVYTYVAGTVNTPKTSYTDSTQTTANPNPVILDARGQANIWLVTGDAYKIVVQNSSGVQQSSTDYVVSNGDTSGAIANKLSRFGDTGTGAYTFDTTSTNGTANQVTPFKITHNNIYTNSPTPYGSGTFLVEATGQNNNQPLQINRKTVDSSSFGNAANLILQNLGGSTATGNSTFAVDFEFVANNPYTTTPRPEGGKFELGVLSNNNSTSKTGCGNFYIAPRRNAQHPSGANTGFDPMVNFRPWSCGGEIEHLGNWFSINPKYDNGNAKITIDNQYGDVSTELTTTKANGSAILLLYGNTGTTTGKWRLDANGTSGRFQIRDDANAGVEAFEVSSADDGLTSVYQRSDQAIGRLRLGNSSPSKIISADSTNTYNFSGSNGVNLTAQGNRYINVLDLQTVAAVDGGSTAITPLGSEARLLLNTGIALATYGIVLPTTPINSQKVCTSGRSNVTSLTYTSADGTATIFNGSGISLTAGQSACMLYRSSGNAWWRIQ